VLPINAMVNQTFETLKFIPHQITLKTETSPIKPKFNCTDETLDNLTLIKQLLLLSGQGIGDHSKAETFENTLQTKASQ
jgi:hypothetical protein